ncbi:MAG: hypothetical protein HDR07_12795 [Lachnospiraceae bacterium]|nr:hypothetical protein [Lachnospiraceae bacterium]
MYSKEKSFDYQILHLTAKFYADYPNPPYKEILKKESRPYNCLLIQSHYGYFICIPYRSHIKHKYAFKFKNSARSKKTHSGLDYSKIVIITKKEYIGTSDAIIDRDEFKETRDNIEYIKNDVQKYIDDYITGISGDTTTYDKVSFKRIYEYSTLPYFHHELGITGKK